MGIRESALEGMVMDHQFWKGKKVLITGHTGFKGSWLSVWLQGKGADVIGLSLSPPSDPNLFELARVSDGMVSIHGDIRNIDEVSAVIDGYRPEIIFHMAAQALVRHSYEAPLETYATNIMGTVNILEAVRLSDAVRVVVNITSDKCYQNKEWYWGYREDEPLGGKDPYSSSKGCAELVISSYRESYFSENNNVMVSSVRAGNVIGGGDWGTDRLVPDVIKAFLDKRTALIRFPNAIRPWQHVLEPLNGYLMLAEKMWRGNEFSTAWNFGPNDSDAKPVSWIADKLTHLWGNGAAWIKDSNQHPHEANYLKLDCSKAKKLLNWMPILDIETALEWVVKWYRAFQDSRDMRQVTESEIEHYEALSKMK